MLELSLEPPVPPVLANRHSCWLQVSTRCPRCTNTLSIESEIMQGELRNDFLRRQDKLQQSHTGLSQSGILTNQGLHLTGPLYTPLFHLSPALFLASQLPLSPCTFCIHSHRSTILFLPLHPGLLGLEVLTMEKPRSDCSFLVAHQLAMLAQFVSCHCLLCACLSGLSFKFCLLFSPFLYSPTWQDPWSDNLAAINILTFQHSYQVGSKPSGDTAVSITVCYVCICVISSPSSSSFPSALEKSFMKPMRSFTSPNPLCWPRSPVLLWKKVPWNGKPSLHQRGWFLTYGLLFLLLFSHMLPFTREPHQFWYLCYKCLIKFQQACLK